MKPISLLPKGLVEKINGNNDLQLVDVREASEWRICNIAGFIHIPLADIPTRMVELNKELPVVVICHHGVRSDYAGRELLRQGFKEVYNLVGGIDKWAREVDTSLELY
ncbi:rhodanese-like domain-containing protein [Chitinophagaceae bacterium LWZ2-11]